LQRIAASEFFFIGDIRPPFNRRIKFLCFSAIQHFVVANDADLAMTQFVSGGELQMPRVYPNNWIYRLGAWCFSWLRMVSVEDFTVADDLT
jgi:hypothetical protein